MGNGYNNHVHRHQNLHLQHKSTIFLPMLCSRPSITDATLPRFEDKSISISNDPLSPKLGCMGQVKRNNKIVGFPASNRPTIASKSDASFVKYSKLRRIFSGRNFGSTTSTSLSRPKSTTCRRKQVVLNGGFRPISKSDDGKESCVSSISIDEMDPPLPVIKKERRKGSYEGEAESLWKRRSGGVALKGLQLQQVELNSTTHCLIQDVGIKCGREVINYENYISKCKLLA